MISPSVSTENIGLGAHDVHCISPPVIKSLHGGSVNVGVNSALVEEERITQYVCFEHWPWDSIEEPSHWRTLEIHFAKVGVDDGIVQVPEGKTALSKNEG